MKTENNDLLENNAGEETTTLTLPKKNKSPELEADINELKDTLLEKPDTTEETKKAADAADLVNEAKDKAAEMLTMALGVVPFGLMIAGLPNTARPWTPDACEKVAKAAIPVLEESAWGKKCIEFLSKHGSVKMVALGAALQPLVMASFEGYLIDQSLKNNNPEKEVKDAGAANDTQN